MLLKKGTFKVILAVFERFVNYKRPNLKKSSPQIKFVFDKKFKKTYNIFK